MGYYSAVLGDYQSYIGGDGNFHFGGASDNFVDFNGTQLVIDTDNFSVDAAGNATFSGALSAATGVLGNPAGNRVEYDGSNLIIDTDNFSVDGSGNATFTGDVTGSTITGSTLRTATGTGRRVVIDKDDNNLQTFNSSNELTSAIGSSFTISGSSRPVNIYAKSQVTDAYAIYAESDDLPAIFGVHNSSGRGVRGSSQSGTGVQGVGATSGDGVRGSANQGGDGVVGYSISGFAFYSERGGYGPFTGAHDGLLEKHALPKLGDILCATGRLEKKSISDTIPYVELSNSANSKAAYGIFVSKSEIQHKLPAALRNQGPSVKLAYIKENYDRSIANALGEGQINVCSENGDFEVGDFICTSNTVGKGMRYDGLDMRYVVAKCMEPVVWADEPDTIKMVACVYMCG